MDALAEFLRARHDEDEQAARATTGPWKYHHETGGVVLPTARHVPKLTEIVSTPRERSDARHMVRWDSARVLREIEAKRATIADYEYAALRREEFAPGTDPYRRYDHRVAALRQVLLREATVYVDHRDYDPEWRPLDPIAHP